MLLDQYHHAYILHIWLFLAYIFPSEVLVKKYENTKSFDMYFQTSHLSKVRGN